MTGRQVNPWSHPLIVYRISLIEADDAVGYSEFQNLMNFSVGILQTLVKLVQVEILQLIT